jgi:hypothetical protein
MKKMVSMEDKIHCNICNVLIYLNNIENHLTTPEHKNSKNRYTEQLNSLEINDNINNKSTYYKWKNTKN